MINPLSVTANPAANPDYLRVVVNIPGTINVRANDKCNNGSSCTLSNPTIVRQAPSGTAAVNPDGTITFTPNANYFGRDSITYIVCDNQAVPKCDTEYVVVNVVEQGPTYNTTIANDDYVITTERTAVSGSILTNDHDPEANTIAVTAQNATLSSGTFTLLANGNYTFTPAVGFKGTAVIKTVICDNGTPSACDTSTLYILVKPYDVTLNPDFLVLLVNANGSGNLNTNDKVPAGGAYGAATVLPGNPAACMPVINANGTYTFTCSTPGEYNFSVPYCPPFYVSVCFTQLLTITVISPTVVNKAPTANPDYITLLYMTSGTINVRSNDVCNNGSSYVLSLPTILRQPLNGTASVNGSGYVLITPNVGFIGSDSVQYSVSDNQSPTPACDTEYVFITVNPIGSANSTVANNDYASTKATTPATGNVLTNDMDPEGNTQTVVPLNLTDARGTFVLNADGSYTYTPSNTIKGPVEYNYSVCDNGSPIACDNATIHFLVVVNNCIISNKHLVHIIR